MQRIRNVLCHVLPNVGIKWLLNYAAIQLSHHILIQIFGIKDIRRRLNPKDILWNGNAIKDMMTRLNHKNILWNHNGRISMFLIIIRHINLSRCKTIMVLLKV